MTPGRRRVDVNIEELDRVLDGARETPLSEADCEKVKTALHALAAMLVRPRNTEKMNAVLPKSEDPGNDAGPQPNESSTPPAKHVGDYIHLLAQAHARLITACKDIASRHPEETEVTRGVKQLAEFSLEAEQLLQPLSARYGARTTDETVPDLSLPPARAGAFGLLRDLHLLFLMASEVHVSTSVVMHASKMLRDEQLLSMCMYLDEQNKRQMAWCNTQLLVRAPHTLVVPS